MKCTFTAKSFAQVATLELEPNEKVMIEPSTALMWDQHITLEGKMNSNGKHGLKGVMSSLGRHFTSGESFFMTYAKADSQGGAISVAPASIGCIRQLICDDTHQYRLNTGTFLASDGDVHYNMKRQELSKAILGNTGGLFVMETEGTGQLLISGFGDILELELNDDSLVIDNEHVLAWDRSLNYEVEIASGALGFKTSEGLVNHFKGTGKIYIQTRNMEHFAETLPKHLSSDD